jgi:hypothetical protein
VPSRPPSTRKVTEEIPDVLVADAVVATIPETVVLEAGVVMETLGPVPPGGTPVRASVTAPRSEADCSSRLITLAGVNDGFAENIRAATPATIGAENEVPQAAP